MARFTNRISQGVDPGPLPDHTMIEDMDREQLLAHWRQLHRASPPKSLSLPILQRALAYELQCRRHGRPDKAVLRALRRAGSATSCGGTPASALLPVGARLVREWNGRRYDVEVIDGGFRMVGKTWPSLSAIAREITGAHWSGPRFFGLTTRGSAGQSVSKAPADAPSTPVEDAFEGPIPDPGDAGRNIVSAPDAQEVTP